MNNRLYLIDLCKYTLSQSLSDTGNYFPFQTAQDILEDLEGGKN